MRTGLASLASATDQLSQLAGPAMESLSNALASDNPSLGPLRSFLSRAVPEEADPAKGMSHRRTICVVEYHVHASNTFEPFVLLAVVVLLCQVHESWNILMVAVELFSERRYFCSNRRTIDSSRCK